MEKCLTVMILTVLLSSLGSPLLAAESKYVIEGQVLQMGSAPEGLTYDPKTGDYTLIYKAIDANDKEYLYKTTFIPATKIEPKLISHFDITQSGTFRYRYTARNGVSAVQTVSRIMMMIPNPSLPRSLRWPRDWEGSEHHITGYLGPTTNETGHLGFNIAWHPQHTTEGKIRTGIYPGKAESGFAYESNDLPGVGVAQLRGYVGKVLGLAGEGPDPESEVGKQFNELDEHNFVSRHVAVPKIRVPNPFNTATVLKDLQKHIKKDLMNAKLVEASFAEQLDRSLTVAIDAAQRGNTDGLRAQLIDIRQMLKKEHGDLDEDATNDGEDDKKVPKRSIDKLAARVLDFDIKYVLKQVGPSRKG